MKIATYNVNGIKARLPVLLRWLNEQKPDVVCLQELKSVDDGFPVDAIKEVGYQAIWHGQKSWNGVAVLASNGYELKETGRGLPGDPTDEQSRYIEATVNGIFICCLYLPNGNPAPGPKFDYKLAWFDRLIVKADELIKKGTPVVLLGDYNVIPTDFDAYKPERFVKDALFFPESKEAYQRLLKQGWIDSIRRLYPDEKVFTFWDYFRNAFGRNAGIRIDHILLSPQLEKRLIAGGIDTLVRGWEKSSDHAPVWIELKE